MNEKEPSLAKSGRRARLSQRSTTRRTTKNPPAGGRTDAEEFWAWAWPLPDGDEDGIEGVPAGQTANDTVTEPSQEAHGWQPAEDAHEQWQGKDEHEYYDEDVCDEWREEDYDEQQAEDDAEEHQEW